MEEPFDMYADVGEFCRRFGTPLYPTNPPRLLTDEEFALRVRHLREELSEFVDCHHAGSVSECADALVDIVYVALGTAHWMGLPFDECWRAVHTANMTKVRAAAASDSKRGSQLDVVKPKGFVPPDHAPAIEAARARHANWRPR